MKQAAIIFAAFALAACGAEGIDGEVDVDLAPQDAEGSEPGVMYLEDGSCVAPITVDFEIDEHGGHLWVPTVEIYDGCNGVKHDVTFAAKQEGPTRRWGTFKGFIDPQDHDAFYEVHGRFMPAHRVHHEGRFFGGYHDAVTFIEIDGRLSYDDYDAPETFSGWIRVRGL